MKHPFGKSWLTMAWGQHPSEWSRDFTEVLCHCQQRAVESALVGDLVLWGQFLEAWKCNGMDSHSQDFSEKVADQLGCDRPWNHLKSGFRFLNQAARLYTVYLLRWHLVASKTSWILSVVWWLGTCCTCVYIVYRDNRYIHIYVFLNIYIYIYIHWIWHIPAPQGIYAMCWCHAPYNNGTCTEEGPFTIPGGVLIRQKLVLVYLYEG